MKVAFVEPINHIGLTSSITPLTLINVQSINDNVFNKLLNFKEIIIDNGVFEFFHSKEFNEIDYEDIVRKQLFFKEKLEEEGKKVYLVLPDVPFNYIETRKLSEKVLEQNDYANFIGVIQGKNYEEVEEMCRFYKKWGVKLIAVPVRLREKLPNVLENIKSYNLNKVHCLGFHLGDLKNKLFFKCRSMDTSYPIKCYLTNTPLGEDISRPSTYLTSKIDNEEKCLEICKEFLKMLKQGVR